MAAADVHLEFIEYCPHYCRAVNPTCSVIDACRDLRAGADTASQVRRWAAVISLQPYDCSEHAKIA